MCLDPGEVLSLVRFHVSHWASISKIFCNYPIGSQAQVDFVDDNLKVYFVDSFDSLFQRGEKSHPQSLPDSLLLWKNVVCS